MARQRRYIALIGLLLVSYLCDAQVSSPITLDRPDQTETPYLVPVGYLQMEGGLQLEKDFATKNTLWPTALWKYGVNERFELRLITELTTTKNQKINKTGLAPITIGFKARLLDEKGARPMTSIICHLTTADIGINKEFHNNYALPSFRFLMNHNVTDKMGIGYNLGMEWAENSAPAYIYTLTSAFSLSNKVGMYLELYGDKVKTMPTQVNFDGGFTYLVNHNVMMDLSGSVNLKDGLNTSYVSLGFSFRTDLLKNKR